MKIIETPIAIALEPAPAAPAAPVTTEIRVTLTRKQALEWAARIVTYVAGSTADEFTAMAMYDVDTYASAGVEFAISGSSGRWLIGADFRHGKNAALIVRDGE